MKLSKGIKFKQLTPSRRDDHHLHSLLLLVPLLWIVGNKRI